MREIDWDDPTEAAPAFFTALLMPLTFNISHGLAGGIVVYALVKTAAGRWREVHWLMYAAGGAVRAALRPAARLSQAAAAPQHLAQLHRVDRLGQVEVEAGVLGLAAVLLAAVAGDRDQRAPRRSRGRAAARAATSKPSSSGRPRSQSTTSGWNWRAASTPARPVLASSTSNPDSSR